MMYFRRNLAAYKFWLDGNGSAKSCLSVISLVAAARRAAAADAAAAAQLRTGFKKNEVTIGQTSGVRFTTRSYVAYFFLRS